MIALYTAEDWLIIYTLKEKEADDLVFLCWGFILIVC